MWLESNKGQLKCIFCDQESQSDIWLFHLSTSVWFLPIPQLSSSFPSTALDVYWHELEKKKKTLANCIARLGVYMA